MKSFEGFKSEPAHDTFPMLPAGAYVCTITGVREDGQYPDDAILLRLDIMEGDWTGYYTRRYDNDARRAAASGLFEPRYKGVFRIRAPRAENPHIGNLEWAIRAFNNAIWAVEDSNEGYHFDFDRIQDLKGKVVGINVRNASYQGALYTEIGRLESARQVREGVVRPMKDRFENAYTASAPAAMTAQLPPDPFAAQPGPAASRASATAAASAGLPGAIPGAVPGAAPNGIPAGNPATELDDPPF